MSFVSPYALELHRAHVARQAKFLAASRLSEKRASAAKLKFDLAEQARRNRELALAKVPESAIDRDLVFAVVWRHLHAYDAIEASARYHGVTPEDIYSHRREAFLVRARRVAMYVAKAATTLSLKQIGQRFGGRDHTTVINAVEKIEDLKASDPELSSEIDALISELKALAWRRAAKSSGPGGDHVRAAIAAGWGG